MQQIVINTRYGGTGIGKQLREAMHERLSDSELVWTEETTPVDHFGEEKKEVIYSYETVTSYRCDIPRDHPELVAEVDGGDYDEYEVVQIPEGVEWVVLGNIREWVAEQHRVWDESGVGEAGGPDRPRGPSEYAE